MKKKLAVLFLIPALVSCSTKVNAPQEIVDFLTGCTIDNALSEVKTISSVQTNVIRDSTDEEKVYGTYRNTVQVDRNDMDDYYAYSETSSTGELVTQDSSSSLYVTKATSFFYYSKDDQLFHNDIHQDGYVSADMTGELKSFDKNVQYQPSQVEDESKKIFYTTTSSSGYLTGGFFFGDFFRSRIKYYDFMKLEDNILSYTLDHFGYDEDTEKGYVDECIKMNNVGMILSLVELSHNITLRKISDANLQVTYNNPITRK